MIHLIVMLGMTVGFVLIAVCYKKERPDLYVDKVAQSRTGVAKIATYPLAAIPALFLILWGVALLGGYIALAGGR